MTTVEVLPRAERTQASEQQELCKLILARLDTQNVKGKATRAKRAIDMLCGAAAALHSTGQPSYNGVAMLAFLTSARGLEVVTNIAEGKPL